MVVLVVIFWQNRAINKDGNLSVQIEKNLSAMCDKGFPIGLLFAIVPSLTLR